MGITAMIPDMTIGQLGNEAESRWGEIWDEDAARMLILVICPRKERKLLELHGDMVEHGQPVLTIFHRPRQEATLLEQQGFNPRDASFQFVELATPDLGPWMQHFISNENWLRNSVEITSVPFTMDMPSQRPFETERVLCFRHPSLPALERYYLPFPPTSIPGKCFVSLPRRQAAELARQQAEVLGVGRLEKKSKITELKPSEMPVAPAPTVADASENMDDMMNDFSANMLDGMTTEAEVNVPRQVALPPQEEPEHVFVPLPPGANSEVSEPEAEVLPVAQPEQVESLDSVNVPIPEPEPEPEPEMSNVEKEFRELVTGLLAAGVDPKDMMDDPRWEDLTERAAAEGFETWPVFLQLAAM
ncbi:MAG: hypothetical protein CBC59_000690 [Euryarchaeota archaeon TMED99]|nr:MAG: hypothetical protein CBC59_000690 [Euryarchaeota archaeon TMED99]|tara:strand:- start:1089 stop:2168 length:1080 start_codon:yes stop_codon:yes gene_type:complete